MGSNKILLGAFLVSLSLNIGFASHIQKNKIPVHTDPICADIYRDPKGCAALVQSLQRESVEMMKATAGLSACKLQVEELKRGSSL